MTPIISREQQDTILTSEITDKHLVVAVIKAQPCILTKGYDQGNKDLSFFTFDRYFSYGNGYSLTDDYDTIQKMVDYWLCDKDCKAIAVFHESDWKKALQWLIDNAK